MLLTLALVAAVTPRSGAGAQATPDSLVRARLPHTEYEALTDSTTRSQSAYAVVDTTVTPPDTFALELRQRWRGRGTAAPVGPVELGLGRTRGEGLRDGGALLKPAPKGPALVFVLDAGRPIRLEQGEYSSEAGRRPTFETAWYRLSAAELRRIAASTVLRLRVGDRELLIDPAWRAVAAEMAAGQSPR